MLGTIAWSYELLNAREQAFLRLISVFAGGFTLEAAERVCRPRRDELPALDLLSSLVDKSLIHIERSDDSVRYRLLDLVRAYALRALQAAGEEATTRSEHALWIEETAERVGSAWSRVTYTELRTRSRDG